jgi:hypothetical protein
MPRKPKAYPELDALKHLMGSMPDHEIAAMANTTAPTVGRYRRRVGLTGYEGHKFGFRQGARRTSGRSAPVMAAEKGDAASRRRSKLDPFLSLLGKISDAEIATKAGVTPQNVRAFRRRHNIKAVYRIGLDAEQIVGDFVAPMPDTYALPPGMPPGGQALPKSAPGAALQGFSVLIEGQAEEIVTIATDIAAAASNVTASLARRRPGARVTAIRYLGPAVG